MLLRAGFIVNHWTKAITCLFQTFLGGCLNYLPCSNGGTVETSTSAPAVPGGSNLWLRSPGTVSALRLWSFQTGSLQGTFLSLKLFLISSQTLLQVASFPSLPARSCCSLQDRCLQRAVHLAFITGRYSSSLELPLMGAGSDLNTKGFIHLPWLELLEVAEVYSWST